MGYRHAVSPPALVAGTGVPVTQMGYEYYPAALEVD